MKTLKFIFLAVLALILGTNSFAQSRVNSTKSTTKTEMIKVSGNCEMCKARIEKAAQTEGVTKADWSIKTKQLTLVYNPSKVKIETIQKRIAAVGHDTPKFRSAIAKYSSLPACCRYERTK